MPGGSALPQTCSPDCPGGAGSRSHTLISRQTLGGLLLPGGVGGAPDTPGTLKWVTGPPSHWDHSEGPATDTAEYWERASLRCFPRSTEHEAGPHGDLAVEASPGSPACRRGWGQRDGQSPCSTCSSKTTPAPGPDATRSGKAGWRGSTCPMTGRQPGGGQAHGTGEHQFQVGGRRVTDY